MKRRRGSPMITGPQECYLRRLLNEAFAKRVDHGMRLDSHHLNTMTLDAARVAIDRVKDALARHK